jgi:glycerol kinase
MFCAIDQGTTLTKVVLFQQGPDGRLCREPVFSTLRRIGKVSSTDGCVEMDPLEIMDTVRNCMVGCTHVPESVSITNQRESIVAWDKVTGLPLHNAICMSLMSAKQF